jgi:RNA polymerase sigma factor FliA
MSGKASASFIEDEPTEIDAPEREPPYVADPPPPPPKDPAEERALVAQALPLVAQMARRVQRELAGRGDLDELESVGRSALLDAVRAHDPARAPLLGFVALRIRWAMLDAVRRDSHVRGRAARANAVGALLRVAEGDPIERPSPDSSEASLQRRFREALEARASALVVGLASASEPPPEELDPEQAALRLSARRAIAQAVAQLPERQRALVERHYFSDERFDDIARSLGVSKSWASRLHAQAMRALAERLREQV